MDANSAACQVKLWRIEVSRFHKKFEEGSASLLLGIICVYVPPTPIQRQRPPACRAVDARTSVCVADL